MSLKGDVSPQRRRGTVLEHALLDAAWAELTESGYDDFTVDAVAVRAGTSRAVLYRRWPGKQDLVLAALAHQVTTDFVAVPDTGSLRGDAVELLKRANEARVRVVIFVLTRLGDFFHETDSSPETLRMFAQGGRDTVLDGAIERAVARGEIGPGPIPERVARLPIDLFRHELMMTLRPVTDEVIEGIVDDVFLPLVRLGAGDRAAT